MIAVDLSNDIIIPSGVAIVGAIVAGISAVLRSWIENRDARSRGDRKLDLASKRTAFAKEWIDISETLKAREANADGDGDTNTDTDTGAEDVDAISTTALVERAREELRQAARDTETAFYDATTDTSTGLRQLRRLLMLVRRVNLASYVVSGTFLFMSVFAWLLVCIPTPGDDDFSIPAAIFTAIVVTFALRVLAGLLVSGLERDAIGDKHKIKDVAVKNDVVTVTTSAPHGLEEGQKVTVDASDDRFDGTFKLTGVPDASSFEFELTAPNAESLPGVTGWVCGESVKHQMRRLFMIPNSAGSTRRSERPKPGAWAIAALFIVPLLAFSFFLLRDSKNDFDNAGYPSCIGEPYDGAYFGGDSVFDPFYDPSDVKLFLASAPEWSENKLRFNIKKETVQSTSDDRGSGYLSPRESDDSPSLNDESWTLEDDNGDKYTLDRNGGLRYEGNRTQLYRRVGVSQMEMVNDPCDPQQLTVSAYPVLPEVGPPTVDGKKGEAWIDGVNTTWSWSEQGWEPLDIENQNPSYKVFGYYDDSKGYLTGGQFALLLGETGAGTTKKISAYFGRDGRLIPVCDSVRYPEIQPCLERGDAYPDSGLDAAVTRAFWAGLLILSAAILWRLLFWAAHKLFGQRAHGDPGPGHRPGAGASEAVVA